MYLSICDIDVARPYLRSPTACSRGYQTQALRRPICSPGRSVRVAVMRVGEVRVAVRERLMPMPMRMLARARAVPMVVMLIMLMRVFMLQRLMAVGMGMALGNVQPDARRHEPSSR
jgi:hypothetical protein